jgi:hypothetical protein
MSKSFRVHKPAAVKPAGRLEGPGARPSAKAKAAGKPARIKEIGGPEGPEPTRYGDWERKGICYDF